MIQSITVNCSELAAHARAAHRSKHSCFSPTVRIPKCVHTVGGKTCSGLDNCIDCDTKIHDTYIFHGVQTDRQIGLTRSAQLADRLQKFVSNHMGMMIPNLYSCRQMQVAQGIQKRKRARIYQNLVQSTAALDLLFVPPKRQFRSSIEHLALDLL